MSCKADVGVGGFTVPGIDPAFDKGGSVGTILNKNNRIEDGPVPGLQGYRLHALQIPLQDRKCRHHPIPGDG